MGTRAKANWPVIGYMLHRIKMLYSSYPALPAAVCSMASWLGKMAAECEKAVVGV